MQRKVVLKEALKYVSDKEKVLDWLGLDPPKGSPSLSKQELSIANVIKIQTLIDQQRKTLADVDYLDLDYVAKVIKIHGNFASRSESNVNTTRFSVRAKRTVEEHNYTQKQCPKWDISESVGMSLKLCQIPLIIL